MVDESETICLNLEILALVCVCVRVAFWTKEVNGKANLLRLHLTARVCKIIETPQERIFF